MLGFCKKFRQQENLGDIQVVCLPEHLMAVQLLKPDPNFHVTWAKGQQLELMGMAEIAMKVTIERI